MGGVYSFTPATYDDLAGQYGVTREWIRQLNKGFLEGLWANCSAETQAQFPLQEIPVRKPLSLWSRERMSQTLPKSQISYQDLKNRISREEDNKKLQEILDGMSTKSIRGFMQRHRSTEQQQAVFISLGNILREAGYHFRSVDIFAEALRSANVPIRKDELQQTIKGKEYPQTYYIVLNKRRDKALEVINNTPDLQHFKQNPVQLAFGPTTASLPSSYEILTKKEKYERLWYLIFDVEDSTGLNVSSMPGIKLVDLLTGSPVPVFRYPTKHRSFHAFPSVDKAELRAFLEERFRQINSDRVF